MSKTGIEAHYDAFYRQRSGIHVYPVEFVVRAFLGNYPRHSLDRSRLTGRTILDLGFGDGRNVPLLANLGLHVHGVEITQEICDLAIERMRTLGVPFEARVGRNSRLPYEDASIDHVLACHSCYYVDHGSSFADNVAEIARVQRAGGYFVFSVPIGSSYILHGARDIGDGHMEIANDPYGVRNGSILKKFDTARQIETALGAFYDRFAIGSCRNDFWGIEEHVWICVCQRRD